MPIPRAALCARAVAAAARPPDHGTMTCTVCPSLLDTVGCPADVRALPSGHLQALAAQIRELLVETVPRTGGHLGPNLGVVELTIALHRVFTSPKDAILWDTGHQAYVHKLLTGRARAFGGLRSAGGLSGYPSRAESEHDLVENSHASTALSYADGLAKAFQLNRQRDRSVVAVVGDGALTGGMAWEALNAIGAAPQRPVVVVLNDNGRSYAPTVGGLAHHLADLRRTGGQGLGQALFTPLGLAYLGPVDGHDIAAVEQALGAARALARPVVVHCVTTKGRGHAPAERDQVDHFHTVSPPGRGSGRAWTREFADELVAIGRERPDVVALTAAMLNPTGLTDFTTAFPERVFDVGIAEQHAVTSAAGLAMGGLHPVVSLYATFLTRAVDQVLMDVGLHRLPVTFVLDRAGITGEDGPSHHGMWDLALLGVVPGMRVGAPRDGARLRGLLREAVAHDGATALRFPKGSLPPDLPPRGAIGRADVLAVRGAGGTLLVAAGPCAHAAVTAAERLDRQEDVTVVDPRWLLPVDGELVHAASGFRRVVTVEDHAGPGGYGDAFARALRAASCATPVETFDLGADFIAHGSRPDLLRARDLDADGLVRRLRRRRVGGA